MTVPAEKFCLRWNDFESNISVAFQELRGDKDFFDVTLACEDDKQIQAHKVILAACSPFFRRVLKRHCHERPLLYLRGVKYTDIAAILNFMYHGEVNVATDELNSFLAVAEDLKVKGLTQSDTDKNNAIPKSNPITNYNHKNPRVELQDTVIQPENGNDKEDSVKSVDFPGIKSEPVSQGEGGGGHASDFTDNQDFGDISYGVNPASGGFRDDIGYNKWPISNQDWEISRGVQNNPENMIPCLMCGKTFKTRGSLATHKYNFHSNKEQHSRIPDPNPLTQLQVDHLKKDQFDISNPFGDNEARDLAGQSGRDVPCPICGKYFSTRGSLATHKYNYHRDRNQTNQGHSYGGFMNLGGHPITQSAEDIEMENNQVSDEAQPQLAMESLEGLDN